MMTRERFAETNWKMTMKTKSYHIRKVKQMNVAAVSISRIVEVNVWKLLQHTILI